jgi:hypothetical protein
MSDTALPFPFSAAESKPDTSGRRSLRGMVIKIAYVMLLPVVMIAWFWFLCLGILKLFF